ncbi:MAG: GDSL-type esterase/lipase family protein [Candidatus Undinarchaeales archaeon]|nr:GDSL-type esterase/lipase family protein [Candidatus Undinarchaeales archaeon]MDP7493841.1 GDSL-type esterase/lipase family protein [Candidatus Undinarchaeales archaeon]
MTGASSQETPRRIAMILGGIILALLLMELAARLLVPQPLKGKVATYDNRVNATFVHMYDGDPYDTLPPDQRMVYRINSIGMRGPDRFPDMSDDVVRIMVLGDSFAFGEGVTLDEAFPSRLEKSLQEQVKVGVRYQVLNAALSGYGTADELARLRDYSQLMRPHVVVVAFTLNDPIPESDMVPFENDLMNLMATANSTRGSASALYDLISDRRSDRQRTSEIEAWYRSFYVGERADRWERSSGDLAAMAVYCREHDIELIVAVLPLIYRLDDHPFTDIHGKVTGFCREQGIQVVDMLPVLKGIPDQELWIHPTDHHPNARAHGMMAEALVRPILELTSGQVNATTSAGSR